MGLLNMGIVNDGWCRPDDESEDVLTQDELDQREREEALNEEDDEDPDDFADRRRRTDVGDDDAED